MNIKDVKLNGKYRVIANETGHDFDIGDIIQVTKIEADIIHATSWTKSWRGEWCLRADEIEAVNELVQKLPNWQIMIEDLLDIIEDQHEGMGQMMYNEIRQLYGYPYEWTCKR